MESASAVAVPESDLWGAKGIWGRKDPAARRGGSAALQAHRMEQLTHHIPPRKLRVAQRPKARELPKTNDAEAGEGRPSVSMIPRHAYNL
eukprot:1354203-Prymnesium_polylepis.2